MHPHAFLRRTPLILSLVSLSFWPLAARDRTAATLETTVDTDIRPGDDFFGYANGAWLKAAVLPPG